jgi:hypothetical protein
MQSEKKDLLFSVEIWNEYDAKWDYMDSDPDESIIGDLVQTLEYEGFKVRVKKYQALD